MLDEAALLEAVAAAAVLELGPEGTGTIGQGVDSSFELRPGNGAPQLTDHTVEEGGRAARDQQGAAQEAVWRGKVPPSGKVAASSSRAPATYGNST